MAGRFSATPDVPVEGLEENLAVLLSAIKENLELLTSTRGESDLASRAVVRGDLTVEQVGVQSMGSVQNVDPEGYTISGSDVAALAAFRALKEDVQELANDVYSTRQALDLLIRNMRGT